MTADSTKNAIRELLSDDDFGLWEIKWHVASGARDSAPPSQELVSALESMIEENEIVIHILRTYPGGAIEPLAMEKALAVVRNPQSYDAPADGEPTFEAAPAGST